MNPVPGPLTIRDVAREARVGVGTVSRVLNGGADVSLSPRSRVLAAIRRQAGLFCHKSGQAAQTVVAPSEKFWGRERLQIL